MPKIMFWCQDLSGTGHFIRTIEIATSLTSFFEVCFINGGEIIPDFKIPSDIKIINLPAIKRNIESKEIQAADLSQNLKVIKEYRKNKLLEVFDKFIPDILVTEFFPFGRLIFSDELIALLERARLKDSSTKIVSSVRDILAKRNNQELHDKKVVELLNQYFDMVLIHGDPNFARIEESFSLVDQIKCKIAYTGYVVQKNTNNHLNYPILNINPQKQIIVVSVGGGESGYELIEATIEASKIIENAIPHEVHIFLGLYTTESKLLSLQISAKDSQNVFVKRYDTRFLDYLEKACLSISKCGYNTTMNILSTGVRAIVYAGGTNTNPEQSIRAKKLENIGIIELIDLDDLKPNLFAEKIIKCINVKNSPPRFDCLGSEKSATFLKEILEE
jgi:predicted glycosyltransferase